MKSIKKLWIMAGLIVLAGSSCNLAASGVADTAEPEPTAPAAVESETASEFAPASTDAADTPTAAPTSTISAVRAGDVRQLTDSPAIDQQPAWSQDGGSLAFASSRSGNFEIYAYILGTEHIRQMTDHPSNDIHPTWSPDSEWIAFESDRTGDPKVLIMQAEGESEPIVLPTSSSLALLRKPEWSRSEPGLDLAGLILHEHEFGDAVGLNFITDRGSFGLPVQDPLIVPGVPLDPSWPPDGERIVFVGEIDRAGNRDLYIIHRTTGELRRLTEHAGADVQPHWSPDGNWIAFASDRDGDMDLYVIRVDGSGLTQLTDSPGYDGEPNWSPTGDRLSFVSDRGGNKDVYMMELSLE